MNRNSGFRFSVEGVLFALTCVLVAMALGCRPPQMPILGKDVHVIQYDTAYEEQLRSGKPLRFGLDGMERYVDSLAEPVAICEWSADHCKWDFFVATNRGIFDSEQDSMAANRVMGQVHYGRCQVTLPRNDVGLRMIEEENDKKIHGELVSHRSNANLSRQTQVPQPITTKVAATAISETAFLEGVADQVRRSREKDVLVFVHGFNVGFEDALSGTAQLALGIPFNGALISYCWPSQGGVMNYGVDEPINQASVVPFTTFLLALREGIPDASIHIVVHSMGNRIVMESLDRLHQAGAAKLFGHVVLCAPDVGTADFQQWAPGVVAVSEHVTLYANASDSALIASKGLHAERRAGDALEPLIVSGIDTIDCSRIDSSWMGHSYFSDNDDVDSDIFLMVKDHQPPHKRFHLSKKDSSSGHYWQFSQHAPNLMYTWHFKHLQ